MAEAFLSGGDKIAVNKAIESAERNTSGEIRVHLDNSLTDDPYKTAVSVFERIGMTETKLRNGVLFYVCVPSRKFAVIGDRGINEKVGEDFWTDVAAELSKAFSAGLYLDGLVRSIELAGAKLKEFFPYQQDDRNELTNEISEE